MSVVLDSSGIYATLDVLLDTRIATLAKMNEALATEVLASGQYHTRLEDKFGEVSVAEFYRHYQQRDGEILMQSMMTNAFVLIRHLFETMLKADVNTRHHKKMMLTVNTYPYDIDATVHADLKRAIEFNMLDLAEVEIVHLPPKEVTPQMCKAQFRFMLMYDWNEWMEAQHEAFQQLAQGSEFEFRMLLPEVVLLAPAIYFNGRPDSQQEKETLVELKKYLPSATSLFDAPEKFASMITNLNLIDVYYFSIVSDFDRPAYTSTLPDLSSVMGRRSGSGA